MTRRRNRNRSNGNGHVAVKESYGVTDAINRLRSSGMFLVKPVPEYKTKSTDGTTVIPHVISFAGMAAGFGRTYRNPDEAWRASRENARYMRNDLSIMECLETRQRMTALLNWHLETDQPKNEKHKELVEGLTAILKTIPRFTEYRRSLLEAIWYGRQGAQHAPGRKIIKGRSCISLVNNRKTKAWLPVQGDKLAFSIDSEKVGFRIGWEYPLDKDTIISGGRERQIVMTPEYGRVYWLEDDERDRVAIHRHIIEDGDFHDPLSAGSIQGLGIRSRIYWTWFQKQTIFALLMEYLERSALGFEIWTFPAGNEQARAAVEQSALNRGGLGKNVVFLPRIVGQEDVYSIEHQETGLAGADVIDSVIHKYFEWQIKRYILGQVLSTEPESGGLGSSGITDFQDQTLKDVIRYDARNLEETLTTELVSYIKHRNRHVLPYGSEEIDVRFVIDTESDKMEEMLEAISKAHAMGLPIKQDTLYEMLGIEKPTAEDELLQGQGGDGASLMEQVPELPPDMAQYRQRSIFERYDKSTGRWVTIPANGEGGGGSPVKIGDDGEILAGPKGLADKGIKKLDDFGKSKGKKKSAKKPPKPKSPKPKPAKPEKPKPEAKKPSLGELAGLAKQAATDSMEAAGLDAEAQAVEGVGQQAGGFSDVVKGLAGSKEKSRPKQPTPRAKPLYKNEAVEKLIDHAKSAWGWTGYDVASAKKFPSTYLSELFTRMRLETAGEIAKDAPAPKAPADFYPEAKLAPDEPETEEGRKRRSHEERIPELFRRVAEREGRQNLAAGAESKSWIDRVLDWLVPSFDDDTSEPGGILGALRGFQRATQQFSAGAQDDQDREMALHGLRLIRERLDDHFQHGELDETEYNEEVAALEQAKAAVLEYGKTGAAKYKKGDDEKWITLSPSGTHVKVDGDGNIIGGPAGLAKKNVADIDSKPNEKPKKRTREKPKKRTRGDYETVDVESLKQVESKEREIELNKRSQSLPENIKKSFHTYSGGDYANINDTLRDCGTSPRCFDGIEKYFDDFRNIDKAIREHGLLDKPVTVFRGVDSKYAERLLPAIEDAIESGDEIEMDGLTSTSLKPEVATGDFGGDSGIVFEIKAKRGIFMGNGLSGMPFEKEFLMAHKSRFKPVGIKKGSAGGYLVQLEEVIE